MHQKKHFEQGKLHIDANQPTPNLKSSWVKVDSTTSRVDKMIWKRPNLTFVPILGCNLEPPTNYEVLMTGNKYNLMYLMYVLKKFQPIKTIVY